MLFSTDNMKRLLAMKPGEDAVWAALEAPVFKTHDGYFGYYVHGDPDNLWTVDCIKGVSPKVFRPAKLTYAGRLDGPDGDHAFAFFGENGSRPGYVMTWPQHYRATSSRPVNVLGDALRDGARLDHVKAFFDRDECAAKCRELNGNFCFSDALGSLGKWYEKTLGDMQRQLRECLAADYVVDPVEKLKDAVAGEDRE